MTKYVLLKVGTAKKNYAKPKIIKVVRTRSNAQKARTKLYKKKNSGRIWIVNAKTGKKVGSTSY